MIPRFKPFFSSAELAAALLPRKSGVRVFEEAFAATFGVRHAVAFPYGRSAQWAFLKALGLEGTEVILPAYTCSVVGHAIVLSGNVPRFIDIRLDDYNMDLGQAEAAMNEHTGAVVATHLFGYPLDTSTLAEMVKAAEQRYGRKIWILQDCAHGFGTEWRGIPVAAKPDAALFGLNISKLMTSIFGGMLITDDSDLAARLRSFLDAHFSPSSPGKSLLRLLYLAAVYPAFNDTVYGLVNWMQEATPLLNRLTKAYHLDEKIHFPPDAFERMLPIEARVGLVQLGKYPEIIRRRRDHARYYSQVLEGTPCLALPPIVEGATYSHYVVRVPDRGYFLRALHQHGVQLGQLIEYSVSHLPPYHIYTGGREFPNSLHASQCTINLPLHAGLSENQRERIAQAVSDAAIKYAKKNHL